MQHNIRATEIKEGMPAEEFEGGERLGRCQPKRMGRYEGQRGWGDKPLKEGRKGGICLSKRVGREGYATQRG